MATLVIDTNEFYEIIDRQHYCCDESQFIYVCKAHGEQQGCYFCEFDYSAPCECEQYHTIIDVCRLENVGAI